jgi:F-type H+-transporting ATPase subunit a
MEHHGPTTWLLQLPFLPHDSAYVHINGAVLVFLFLLVCSLAANWLIRHRLEQHVIPSPRLTLVSFVDLMIEGLYGMITSTLGESGIKHFSFIASVFLFVLFGNLLGLLPYSGSPTANVNTTFALGGFAFIYYNIMGIREHGLVGYLKHFLMGLGLFGIPIAFLELISHAVRPISLSVRLFVNMFVDHALAAQFGEVFAWLLPVPLLFLGIVVCVIQAFVFATLTSVYVQMATEHEHSADEHGHGLETQHAH